MMIESFNGHHGITLTELVSFKLPSPSGTALIQSGWNITQGRPFPDKVAEWNGLLL